MPHPLTLWTARAVVAFCLAAWLLAARGDRRTERGFRVWRSVWTAACAALAIHIPVAMHFEHGWSHAAALEHTAQQTHDVVGIDWAGGLYFNYGMLLLWTVDVGLLWQQREQIPAQRHWISRLNEYVCAFMILNATVVFGPAWWYAVAVVFGTAVITVRQKRRLD